MDDSLGGHLINPASATLRFSNSEGVELRPSERFTGELAEGALLSNYYASQGPVLPSSDGSPASEQAQRDALAVYYRVGDSFTYTAPVIDGVTPTPASYTFVLGAVDGDTTVNDRVFTYAVADGSDTGPGPALADTGATLLPMVAGAIAAIGLAVSMLYRQSRRRTNRC